MIRISQIDEKLSIFRRNSVVLLGIGKGNHELINLLRFYKINIKCICDNDPKYTNKLLDNIPVYSTEAIANQKFTAKVVVQVATNELNTDLQPVLNALNTDLTISYDETYHMLNLFNEIKLQESNNPIFNRNDKCTNQIFHSMKENCNLSGYQLVGTLSLGAVFICMIGKTGDHTLMNTFEEKNILFHNAKHSPETLNRSLLNQIDNKVRIITSIRDPISWNLSLLYHYFATDNAFAFSNIIKHRKNLLNGGGDVQSIFNLFLDRYGDKQDTVLPFLNRFEQHVLSLSKHTFDKEKGFSVFNEGNIEVFAYQLEKMNDIIEDLSDWVGAAPFDKWVMGNEASSKWISGSYKQAQSEIKIPKAYFDKCYDDKWVKHFYSNKDIEAFKEKWKNQVI